MAGVYSQLFLAQRPLVLSEFSVPDGFVYVVRDIFWVSNAGDGSYIYLQDESGCALYADTIPDTHLEDFFWHQEIRGVLLSGETCRAATDATDLSIRVCGYALTA